MTASVTMTAAALMPAILIRNGTPVAARSDEVVMELSVIRWPEEGGAEGTRIRRVTAGKSYFPTSLSLVTHVERWFDGQRVGHPGPRRRGAHPRDRGPIRRGLWCLVSASRGRRRAHRGGKRQSCVGSDVSPCNGGRIAVRRLHGGRPRADDDSYLPACRGGPPRGWRADDLGEPQPDRVERT